MTATAAEVARLRRMVGEPETTTYSDDDLSEYIERYPVLDEEGAEPYTWDISTTPPTQDENDTWIPTYDLNAAAADIWTEKAAAIAPNYQFSADGGSYNRQQVFDHYMHMARHYRARRKAGTMRLHKWPDEGSADAPLPPWVANAPEGGS